MSGIFLQRMLENLPDGFLPANWTDFDLAAFSPGKRLFEYQQDALRNALLALWKYYGDPGLNEPERKQAFYAWYRDFGLEGDLDLPLDASSAARRRLTALLETYYESEADAQGRKRLPFVQFINRMSFWMATASGKTLVIVKLLELLRLLMQRREIPAHDVLVLAHRDDLLEQLRRHVDEFNSAGGLFIRLRELREYAEARRIQPSLFQGQEMTVFYYRSDNLSDEQKEKIIDFRSYDNYGRWYILLDEAHKGDKEDSKRQSIYSILSRSGFLFNFSATFVDERDILTTVSNFNLSEFTKKGHGKHLCILRQEARSFRKGDEYNDLEKQKIVLKALMMLANARRFEARVRAVRQDLYHRPLMMVLVNSVNTEEADLKLFFRELARIGRGEIDETTWSAAKQELLAELRASPSYMYESDARVNVDESALRELDLPALLKDVFNAASPGEIEVLVRPSNRQEVAFKLKTCDDPFALVRIGDVSDWLKQELSGYEIDQHFADEGFFEQLNRPDSDINLLLGSRTFYEGWDSNRPNVIVYINIGVGQEARKFILQSVGRGVRIEPFKNQRKRLRELQAGGLLKPEDAAIFPAVKDLVQPLETVFIFGTNREALNLVIGELDQEENQAGVHEIALALNEEALREKVLLAPVYRSAGQPLYRERSLAKFQLAPENLDLLQRYLDYVDDDRVLLALYDTYRPEQVSALRASLLDAEGTYRQDGRPYKNLDVLARQALNFFSVHGKELAGFKPLEGEINHYLHIKVSLEEMGDLEQRIRRVVESVERIREAQARFLAKQISIEEFTAQVSGGALGDSFYAHHFRLDIKRLANHYYVPLLLSQDEQIDFIQSVIKVKSEVKFLEQLEEYIGQEGNLFKQFDWWLFSRVDEKSDNISIPYYFPVENRIANFKPDFIFWLQKGERYWILFIDPKGTGRSEYEHKVDGYRSLFEQNGKPRIFDYEELRVTVHAYLHTPDRQYLAEGYRRFWFERMEQVLKEIID
jgi:type III restriction enzyme